MHAWVCRGKVNRFLISPKISLTYTQRMVQLGRKTGVVLDGFEGTPYKCLQVVQLHTRLISFFPWFEERSKATMAISGMQRAFNKVVRHLRKQNAKAMTNEENGAPYCAYRGSDGKECAFGCLIPNKMYDKKMEGMTAWDLLEDYPKLENHLTRLYGEHGARFYNKLQNIHDDNAVERWEDQFNEFAHDWNLKVPRK